MLRAKIINGELQADSRIIESDVAKCMEVSRGPVREALKILEFEGLVTYESNKGCRVTNLSMEDAYEVFFLRGNLEIMALRQAGGRLPDTSLLTMRSYLEGMERAQKDKNLLQMVQMDELFHREIVSAGNMKRLVRMWESLSPLNGAMFLKVNDIPLSCVRERLRRKSSAITGAGIIMRLISFCWRSSAALIWRAQCCA